MSSGVSRAAVLRVPSDRAGATTARRRPSPGKTSYPALTAAPSGGTAAMVYGPAVPGRTGNIAWFIPAATTTTSGTAAPEPEASSTGYGRGGGESSRIIPSYGSPAIIISGTYRWRAASAEAGPHTGVAAIPAASRAAHQM